MYILTLLSLSLFLAGCNSTQSAKISLFELTMSNKANDNTGKNEKMSYELTTQHDSIFMKKK